MLLCNRNGIPVRCHHPHLLRSFHFDDLNLFRMIAFFGVARAVHLISITFVRHTHPHPHACRSACPRRRPKCVFDPRSKGKRERAANETTIRITILRQKLNFKFSALSFVVLHLNLILDEAASASASINNFSLFLPRFALVFILFFVSISPSDERAHELSRKKNLCKQNGATKTR